MGRHSKAGGPVRLVLTLSVLALFAVAVVFAVSGCGVVTPEKAVAAGHPAVASDTPCTSCKDPQHTFEHRDPYKGDCRTCHNTLSWIQVSYSHANVAFNQGMHLAVGCDYCHTEQNPYPSANCAGCHESKHQVVLDCAKCHQAVAWNLAVLPEGHMSLDGGHKGVSCFECHKGSNAFSFPNGCASCHGPSRHGGLTDCGSCHDPSLGWNQPKPSFDHNDYFVLTGQHKTLECTQCHPKNQFAAASPQCVSCHGTQHGGLTDCSACHTTSSFKPSTFQHSSVWTLTGAHKHVACTKCHPSAQYAKAIGNKNSCVSCHGTHHGGLSDCADCHTTTTFKPSTFEHSSVWTLTGAHKHVACTKCHPDNKYAQHGNKNSCVSCHGTHHGGLSDCADCHTTTSFKPSTFEHSSVWTLTGAHKDLPCTKCHPDNKYAQHGDKDSCVSCHGTQHGNQTQCEKCHTTSTFSPANDGIAEMHPSTVPLGQEHAPSDLCTRCHPTLVFNAPTKPCVDCHTAPHVEPTNCIECHVPTVWSDTSKFQHADIGYHTQFPIEQACLKCHTTGNYAEYRCDHCHPAVPYP